MRSIIIVLFISMFAFLLPVQTILKAAPPPNTLKHTNNNSCFIQPHNQLPHSPRENIQSDLIRKMLNRTVAKNKGYGGAIYRVTIGRHNRILWNDTAGNLQYNGNPITPNASFEIASVTKTFTAASVLRLMEQGLVDLDIPISNYLSPEYTTGLLVIDGHDYTPELTLRQLLSHTSGLADYWNDPPFIISNLNAFLISFYARPMHDWTPKEILSYVPLLTPRFKPGTGWHYSDTGYVLAGLIIEQVTGKPLHEAYNDLIYQPLNMHHTWLRWRESAPNDLINSHRYEGNWDMFTHRNNSADWAGGGLDSTSQDLEKFIRALADNTFFTDPDTMKQMTHWTPTDDPEVQYGLGLFRVQLTKKLGWVWGHDGYGSSWMYYWPDHDVIFTGTLNQTNNESFWYIMIASARIIANNH